MFRISVSEVKFERALGHEPTAPEVLRPQSNALLRVVLLCRYAQWCRGLTATRPSGPEGTEKASEHRCIRVAYVLGTHTTKVAPLHIHKPELQHPQPPSVHQSAVRSFSRAVRNPAYSVVTMVKGSAPRHAFRLPSPAAHLSASSSQWPWLVSLSRWAPSVGDRTNVQQSEYESQV